MAIGSSLCAGGREKLGQRFTRMIAEGTGIETTTGTENTQWVEPETIPGSKAPFAGDKKEEAEEAKRH